MNVDLMEKLTILGDSAKYDVACTSSGVDRVARRGGIGSAVGCGICHSFTADGRCVSLLKVLLSNSCAYNCAYCQNRRENDVRRAAFAPRELAELTIAFYRRNYIEGLFLSSAIIRNPDETTEQMIRTLRILREEYRFSGYIHAKAIPGTDERLIARLGCLADRMSVNIEMPSQKSLNLLAPDKSKTAILRPMRAIRDGILADEPALAPRDRARFVPAGQSTQMIVGASPESDLDILRLTDALYRTYRLRRVFFSAYVPVVADALLPALDTKPPMLREHRLYQADWLMRVYGFQAREILDEKHPNFHPLLDPKCNWAINHYGEHFPVDIQRAPYEALLRTPGIGVVSARRLVAARRGGRLSFEDVRKLGGALKRAQYFITCDGRATPGVRLGPEAALGALTRARPSAPESSVQLSLFDTTREDLAQCITGQM